MGGCTSPGAPIPEHPAPASQSVQDSYISKGGPLGGVGHYASSGSKSRSIITLILSQFKKNSSLKLFAKVTVKEFGPGKGPFDD